MEQHRIHPRWSPWVRPYVAPGKTNPVVVANLPTGKISGGIVYRIARGPEVVYVGYSSAQPRRTLLRHFQAPAPGRAGQSKQTRGTELAVWTVAQRGWSPRDCWVSWIRFKSAAQARAYEKALLGRRLPRGNAEMRGLEDAPF